MELELSYSLYWLWACAAFSGLLTLLAYYRNPSVSNLNTTTKSVAATLRFLAIFLLGTLLLKPLVQSFEEEYEKPTLIVAIDHSESILNGSKNDDATTFEKRIQAFIDGFGEKFNVVPLSFGDEISDTVSYSFTQKFTDYSTLQTTIDNRFAQTNVAGVIVASDGLYNKGMNPLYQSTEVSAPLYTVLLGDSTEKLDISIAAVQHNQIVFKGNKFPVKVDLRQSGFISKTIFVSISQNGKVLDKKTVDPKKQQFVDFQLEANKLGVASYEVRAEVIDDELILSNNTFPFFIDVLQNEYKVLLLTEAPHPDVNAVRQALEKKQDYDVEVAYSSDLSKDFSSYQLVIAFTGKGLHINNINNKASELGIPICWFVQSNVARSTWNGLSLGVKLESEPQENRVLASVAKNLTLFKLTEESRSTIEDWPEVSVPFGKYILGTGTEVVTYQQVGNVVTKAPIIAVRNIQDEKTGFVFADGLWRWRVANYRQYRNFEVFDELITRIVRYVLVKADKSRFRITYPKLVSENASVLLEAELYNPSLDLTTEGEVKIKLIDSNNISYDYQLIPQGNSYNLNIGSLPLGTYDIKAEALLGKEKFNKLGKLLVTPITIEQTVSRANHELLAQWSSQRNGTSFLPTELNKLAQIIEGREDVKTIIHQKKKYSSWLEQWWPLLIVMVLLTSEWFVRKYSGSF